MGVDRDVKGDKENVGEKIIRIHCVYMCEIVK